MNIPTKFIWVVLFVIVVPLILFTLYKGGILKKVQLPGGTVFEFETPTSAPGTVTTPQLPASTQSSETGITPKSSTSTQLPGPGVTTQRSLTGGVFWLQAPNTWYGPFAGGDGIAYSSAGGFYVWDANRQVELPYPDPYSQIPRNVWVPLLQSRFSVWVDIPGNVFIFVP
jgi:hypothetical protein